MIGGRKDTTLFGAINLEDLKSKTVRGSFAKLCGQVISFGLRLGFLIIMARLLDPVDFGLVAMVTVVTGILELFATAGLSAATIQSFTITDEQVSTLFWINILVGVLLGLLCLATAPALAAFYGEPRLLWIAAALALGFVLSGAGVQYLALLQRELRYFALAIVDIIAQFTSIAIGVGLAVAGFGYWALVIAAIALRTITTACMWGISTWRPGWPGRVVGVSSMLWFGGTITLNNLVVYIGYNFEKALLGRFWGADVLGLYGRAFQLIDVPTSTLNSAIGGVAFSALSRLQNDPVRLKSYFLKGYSAVNALTLPATMFCAFFAHDIIVIVLGPKWIEVTTIFRLLAPTILVFGIINPTGWLLQATGLQARSLRIALVIAPLVITACIIGLPYGPTGVAFAFSAVMTLWLVPHVFWCSKNTVIAPSDLFLSIWRPFLASFLSTALAFIFVQFSNLNSPLLHLLVGSCLMGALYATILLFIMGQKQFYFDLMKSLWSS